MKTLKHLNKFKILKQELKYIFGGTRQDDRNYCANVCQGDDDMDEYDPDWCDENCEDF